MIHEKVKHQQHHEKHHYDNVSFDSYRKLPSISFDQPVLLTSSNCSTHLDRREFVYIVSERDSSTHKKRDSHRRTLKQFLAVERPLKTIENAFCFTLKALSVLKIFEKQLA